MTLFRAEPRRESKTSRCTARRRDDRPAPFARQRTITFGADREQGAAFDVSTPTLRRFSNPSVSGHSRSRHRMGVGFFFSHSTRFSLKHRVVNRADVSRGCRIRRRRTVVARAKYFAPNAASRAPRYGTSHHAAPRPRAARRSPRIPSFTTAGPGRSPLCATRVRALVSRVRFFGRRA